MKHLPFLLALGLLGLSHPAPAQWIWLDAGGSKVYSDRPPPPEVPASKLLRQPAASAPRPHTADAGDAPPNAGRSPVGAKPGTDATLDARKRQLDDEQQARRKAEEEKWQRARAENCERARSNLNTLQSGIRMTQVGPGGERSYLSDEARAQEVQRVQGLMQAECN